MKQTPLKKAPGANLQLTEKLTENYLDVFVRELAGDEGCKIISCIGNTEVTDENIEQSTKMKIAEIRSVLNHLHSYGLVEYRREKNMQTGWFTYTWRLNANRALQNFISLKKREYETLKTRLEKGDGTQLYKCGKTCAMLEFEKAMESSFRCPGCKGKLNTIDETDELKKLEQKITALVTISNSAPVLPLPSSPLSTKLTAFNK